MKTSVSILDAIFGKRVYLEVPNPTERGGMRRISVTKKWLEKMTAQAMKRKVNTDSIVLFLIGPRGEQTTTLRVGVDIKSETAAEYRDPGTGAIYGFYSFEKGERQTFLLQRQKYDELKSQLSSQEHKAMIQAEVDRAMRGQKNIT